MNASLHSIQRDSLLARIMDQSMMVSMYAPTLKPFIRFAHHAPADVVRHYWDFDDGVQKRLLEWTYELASAQRIVDEGIRRWKQNLQSLFRTEARRFQEAQQSGVRERPRVRVPHLEKIHPHIKQGGRMLFVGAGTGTMCLQLAEFGIQVVGIDPLVHLLSIGKAWADYLELPATFVGMDVRNLAFKPHSFDSFYLGIYGSLPTVSQNHALLWEMARVLKPDGVGIVAGIRKMYASHWYRMGHTFPPALVKTLLPQVALDFRFTSVDGSEERLRFGLYHRSHSTETLRQELSATFEVTECSYNDDDLRYLTAIVRPKAGFSLDQSPPPAPAFIEPDISDTRRQELDALIRRVETMTVELNAHAQRAITVYADTSALSQGERFRYLASQVGPCIHAVYECLKLDATASTGTPR